MRWLRTAIGVVLVLVFGACAQDEEPTVAEPTASPAAATASPGAAAAVRTESNPTHGTILVDAQGRSLYTFDRDTGGKSACTDDCASIWPPVISTGAQGGVEGLGTVKRPDGTDQLTYKDKPLYRYSGDAKAGDVKGDGVGGVWHVAKVS